MATYNSNIAAAAGHYPLTDNAATTVVDDTSSNDYNGTLTNAGNTEDIAVSPGPASYLPTALHFDGINDYVDTNNSFRTTDLTADEFTVAFRVKFNSFPTAAIYGSRVAISGGTAGFVLSCLSGGTNLQMSFFSGGFVTSGATGFSAGEWHDVVLAYKSLSATFWVDGSSIGTASGALGAPLDTTTLDDYIGCHNDKGTAKNFFDGYLSDFVISATQWDSSDVAEYSLGPEPLNTVAPAITGTEAEGETLTCDGGTWDSQSNGTVTLVYQWYRADDAIGTNEAAIAGETSATYLLAAADVGKYLRCLVAATNNGGNDPAEDTYSAYTGAIASAIPAQPSGVFRSIHGVNRLFSPESVSNRLFRGIDVSKRLFRSEQ